MLSGLDIIKIIDEKIAKYQELYSANDIAILNSANFTSEDDYGLDKCLELKKELEHKINVLMGQKQALTNLL